MLKFTKDHEWLRIDGNIATLGITDYAQQQLGDIVFVELPRPGKTVEKGSAAAVVESVKAASDIYTALSGEVLETNQDVVDSPELVNSSPYDKAWLVKVRMSDPSEVNNLMDSEAYTTFAAEQSGH